jgi:hypothetical protein
LLGYGFGVYFGLSLSGVYFLSLKYIRLEFVLVDKVFIIVDERLYKLGFCAALLYFDKLSLFNA